MLPWKSLEASSPPTIHVPPGFSKDAIAHMALQVLEVKLFYCQSRECKNILRKSLQILCAPDEYHWVTDSYSSRSTQTTLVNKSEDCSDLKQFDVNNFDAVKKVPDEDLSSEHPDGDHDSQRRNRSTCTRSQNDYYRNKKSQTTFPKHNVKLQTRPVPIRDGSTITDNLSKNTLAVTCALENKAVQSDLSRDIEGLNISSLPLNTMHATQTDPVLMLDFSNQTLFRGRNASVQTRRIVVQNHKTNTDYTGSHNWFSQTDCSSRDRYVQTDCFSRDRRVQTARPVEHGNQDQAIQSVPTLKSIVSQTCSPPLLEQVTQTVPTCKNEVSQTYPPVLELCERNIQTVPTCQEMPSQTVFPIPSVLDIYVQTNPTADSISVQTESAWEALLLKENSVQTKQVLDDGSFFRLCVYNQDTDVEVGVQTVRPPASLVEHTTQTRSLCSPEHADETTQETFFNEKDLVLVGRAERNTFQSGSIEGYTDFGKNSSPKSEGEFLETECVKGSSRSVKSPETETSELSQDTNISPGLVNRDEDTMELKSEDNEQGLGKDVEDSLDSVETCIANDEIQQPSKRLKRCSSAQTHDDYKLKRRAKEMCCRRSSLPTNCSSIRELHYNVSLDGNSTSVDQHPIVTSVDYDVNMVCFYGSPKEDEKTVNERSTEKQECFDCEDARTSAFQEGEKAEDEAEIIGEQFNYDPKMDPEHTCVDSTSNNIEDKSLSETVSDVDNVTILFQEEIGDHIGVERPEIEINEKGKNAIIGCSTSDPSETIHEETEEKDIPITTLDETISAGNMKYVTEANEDGLCIQFISPCNIYDLNSGWESEDQIAVAVLDENDNVQENSSLAEMQSHVLVNDNNVEGNTFNVTKGNMFEYIKLSDMEEVQSKLDSSDNEHHSFDIMEHVENTPTFEVECCLEEEISRENQDIPLDNADFATEVEIETENVLDDDESVDNISHVIVQSEEASELKLNAKESENSENNTDISVGTESETTDIANTKDCLNSKSEYHEEQNSEQVISSRDNAVLLNSPEFCTEVEIESGVILGITSDVASDSINDVKPESTAGVEESMQQDNDEDMETTMEDNPIRKADTEQQEPSSHEPEIVSNNKPVETNDLDHSMLLSSLENLKHMETKDELETRTEKDNVTAEFSLEEVSTGNIEMIINNTDYATEVEVETVNDKVTQQNLNDIIHLENRETNSHKSEDVDSMPNVTDRVVEHNDVHTLITSVNDSRFAETSSSDKERSVGSDPCSCENKSQVVVNEPLLDSHTREKPFEEINTVDSPPGFKSCNNFELENIPCGELEDLAKSMRDKAVDNDICLMAVDNNIESISFDSFQGVNSGDNPKARRHREVLDPDHTETIDDFLEKSTDDTHISDYSSSIVRRELPDGRRLSLKLRNPSVSLKEEKIQEASLPTLITDSNETHEVQKNSSRNKDKGKKTIESKQNEHKNKTVSKKYRRSIRIRSTKSDGRVLPDASKKSKSKTFRGKILKKHLEKSIMSPYRYNETPSSEKTVYVNEECRSLLIKRELKVCVERLCLQKKKCLQTEPENEKVSQSISEDSKNSSNDQETIHVKTQPELPSWDTGSLTSCSFLNDADTSENSVEKAAEHVEEEEGDSQSKPSEPLLECRDCAYRDINLLGEKPESFEVNSEEVLLSENPRKTPTTPVSRGSVIMSTKVLKNDDPLAQAGSSEDFITSAYGSENRISAYSNVNWNTGQIHIQSYAPPTTNSSDLLEASTSSNISPQIPATPELMEQSNSICDFMSQPNQVSQADTTPNFLPLGNDDTNLIPEIPRSSNFIPPNGNVTELMPVSQTANNFPPLFQTGSGSQNQSNGAPHSVTQNMAQPVSQNSSLFQMPHSVTTHANPQTSTTLPSLLQGNLPCHHLPESNPQKNYYTSSSNGSAHNLPQDHIAPNFLPYSGVPYQPWTNTAHQVPHLNTRLHHPSHASTSDLITSNVPSYHQLQTPAMSRLISQSNTASHQIPHSSLSSHHLTQSTTSSLHIPQSNTSSHLMPQATTDPHVAPTSMDSIALPQATSASQVNMTSHFAPQTSTSSHFPLQTNTDTHHLLQTNTNPTYHHLSPANALSNFVQQRRTTHPINPTKSVLPHLMSHSGPASDVPLHLGTTSNLSPQTNTTNSFMPQVNAPSRFLPQPGATGGMYYSRHSRYFQETRPAPYSIKDNYFVSHVSNYNHQPFNPNSSGTREKGRLDVKYAMETYMSSQRRYNVPPDNYSFPPARFDTSYREMDRAILQTAEMTSNAVINPHSRPSSDRRDMRTINEWYGKQSRITKDKNTNTSSMGSDIIMGPYARNYQDNVQDHQARSFEPIHRRRSNNRQSARDCKTYEPEPSRTTSNMSFDYNPLTTNQPYKAFTEPASIDNSHDVIQPIPAQEAPSDNATNRSLSNHADIIYEACRIVFLDEPSYQETPAEKFESPTYNQTIQSDVVTTFHLSPDDL